MAPKTNNKAKNNFTFSQATEGFFLNATARGLSDATLRDYGNTIKRFSEFLGEDLPISGITTQHIERFLSSQGHLSNKTLLNYHTGLSALWTWATIEELVEKHIVRAIIAPKPEKREIVPFSENEIKLMLGSLEKSRAYTRPGKKLSDHAVLGVAAAETFDGDEQVGAGVQGGAAVGVLHQGGDGAPEGYWQLDAFGAVFQVHLAVLEGQVGPAQAAYFLDLPAGEQDQAEQGEILAAVQGIAVDGGQQVFGLAGGEGRFAAFGQGRAGNACGGVVVFLK